MIEHKVKFALPKSFPTAFETFIEAMRYAALIDYEGDAFNKEVTITYTSRTRTSAEMEIKRLASFGIKGELISQ